MPESVNECGGCGRFYNADLFDEACPFCYVQEFLEVEALESECPICKKAIESSPQP